MAFKVTINSKDVKNPIARLLLTLLGLVIALLSCVVLFFLVFPLIWFVVVTMLLVIVTIFLTAPKFVSTYRIILLNRKTLERDK